MEPYRNGLKPLAQQLRSHQTDAETALWHRLRRQQLGVIFNRQKPIGNYIVDFYSAAAKLVIELDGSQHLTQQGQHDDQRRDQYLLSLGLTILRVDNLQVLNEIEGVMTVVFETVQKQIPPNPPSTKGGATAANQLSSAPSPPAITEKITKPSSKAELIPPSSAPLGVEKGGLGGISTRTEDNK